jgi:hypothetical protein
MLFRIQAITLLVVSASVLSFAADDTKPVCDASTGGLLWPEAANHDFKLRKKFSRCGELEVCTRGRWHFRWQSVTVRLDQLRGGSQLPKPPGCEVLPEAAKDDDGAPVPEGASPAQR